ncbi:MAG TPA: hypothetical protein VM600_01085, partial [Actinomycetota bacterium]|nr:hypothetical protein [Actinomycetota bacterium]
MKRLAFLAAAAAIVALLAPGRALAALQDVSVGNYYFEVDATGARDPIVVKQGDQIRFTIREPDYPPHTINIDELQIESPDLLLFDTYTTPPLKKPGTYLLYCKAHKDRGHETSLVVKAAPKSASSPGARAAASATPRRTEQATPTADGSPAAATTDDRSQPPSTVAAEDPVDEQV